MPVKSPNDNFDVLNANREVDKIESDASGQLILCRELLMGSTGGMNDQAASIANVGEIREEAYPVNDRLSCFVTTPDAEGEDGAGAEWEIALSKRVRRVVR